VFCLYIHCDRIQVSFDAVAIRTDSRRRAP